MTKYPLPTPQMFAVHAEAVHRTQRYWAIYEAVRKFRVSMNATMQATISSLTALEQFAKALAKLKLDKDKKKGDES